MEATLAVTILALLTALVAVFGVFGERANLTRHAINASWLGLVACFVGVYMEQLFGAGAALASAVFASLAVLPVEIHALRTRQTIHGVGASVAVVLATGALMIAANSFYIAPIKDPDLILYAGQWAAMAACFCAFAAGAVVSGWREDDTFAPAGAGVVLGGLAMLAMMIAYLRVDLPDVDYAIPLTSGGGHVRWALPAVTGGSRGFGFDVTQVVAGASAGVILTTAIALIASFGQRFIGAARAMYAWLAAGISGAVTLGLVINAGFSPRLPDAAPYFEHARAVGAGDQIPERILVMGGFDHGDRLYVLWLDILPDVMLLGGVVVLAVMLAWLHRYQREMSFDESYAAGALKTRVAPAAGESSALWARDMGLKGSALAWLAFILSTFVMWRAHAVFGFASPREWVIVGAALAALGACVMSWRERGWAQSSLLGVGAIAMALAAAVLVV